MEVEGWKVRHLVGIETVGDVGGQIAVAVGENAVAVGENAVAVEAGQIGVKPSLVQGTTRYDGIGLTTI